MKTRTNQPKNNKYYIRTVSGGLNNAVAGKPIVPGANVLCNCVGYANGRFNEIINDPDLKGVVLKFKYQLVCNAENFIESAKRQGLSISNKPIQGGVMCWKRGATLSGSDGAGHVAIVEEVYADGSILTSESGWNAWAFKTVHRTNSNGRWGQPSGYTFRGCIINPGVKNPEIAPEPKLTTDGVGGPATVRAMQRFFGTVQDGIISGQRKTLAKYYPALTAVEYGSGGSACVKKLQKWLSVEQDGVIGSATVKAWQRELGVAVDGIFGTGSMKAWQKYLNEHDKAVYPTAPEPTRFEKANAWAKVIAGEKYHYVKWLQKVTATHTCPICKGRKYNNNFGWNCIGFAFAIWHHGAGLGNKCSCGVITNQFAEKLVGLSAAEALKETRAKVGLNDIKVIRNGGKNIPKSEWREGDICLMFSGSKYTHTFYYMGNGKIADSRSGSSDASEIAVRDYGKYSARIIIRYIGK